MDWARLLHCNLGWSCEHFDHHICIFSKMWLFWCHKTICREFAPWFQFPQCAISSTNCPLIKIRCDFPLFDHPEGSVPRWPLVLVTHRPPLGLMLSRWEACHLWPRSGRDAVTTAKKKKTKEKNSANWPKAGHTHFSTECLIRPKECRPFLPQVKSLTGKAFDPALPGWFSGSGWYESWFWFWRAKLPPLGGKSPRQIKALLPCWCTSQNLRVMLTQKIRQVLVRPHHSTTQVHSNINREYLGKISRAVWKGQESREAWGLSLVYWWRRIKANWNWNSILKGMDSSVASSRSQQGVSFR